MLIPFLSRNQKVEKMNTDGSVNDSEQLVSFMKPDSVLTWRLVDGHFKMSFDSVFEYTMQHSEEKRVTSANGMKVTQPKVAFFGCSFTYGLGLHDSLTFPYLVQTDFQEMEIHNFGVPGYGTLHCLWYMNEQLEKENFDKLFYFYIDDHDNRNALLNPHRRVKYFSIRSHFQEYLEYLKLYGLTIDDMNFSQYCLDKQDSLIIQKISYQDLYTEIPFANYSITAYQLEKFMNRDDGKLRKNAPEITHRLIKQMHSVCEKKQIEFYFVGLGASKRTEDVLQFCKENKIHSLYIDIDLYSDSMTLYPYDNHPNVFANQLIADSLSEYFSEVVY